MPKPPAEIGNFKIGIDASEPPTEDAQRRRVEALIRWLTDTFTRQGRTVTDDKS